MTDERTVPISVDNLTDGNFWEADGASWRYERDQSERGWRMQPRNLRALRKGEPNGPMFDFYPLIGTSA